MRAMKTISVLMFCSMLLSMFIPTAHSAEPGTNSSQDRLAHARSLGKQGNIDEAVEQYQIYYANNPEKHAVLQWISGLYENSGRIKEAIEFVERSLVSGDESLMRDSHFQEQCDRLLRLWEKTGGGKILRIFGKADGIELAREHYLAKLGDANTKPRMIIIAQLMLGDIENKVKDVVKARKYYLAAFDLILPPTDEWQKAANRVLWRKFMKKSWFDDALAIYRNYPNYNHLMQLGQWLKRQGRGFEMLELYEDYLFSGYREVDDDGSVRHADKGLGGSIIDESVSLGQGESLIEQFNSIIVEHPENYRLHRNFGYLLFKMKRYEEGLSELEKYLTVMDNVLVSDYQWVGSLCRKAGMIDEAIEFYETARDMEVTDAEVRAESMMSQMAASDGHWKARFKARILETLGNLYMKKNRWADAESCFKEIVDLQSGRSKEKAQVNLAKIWERMGKENAFVEELKGKVANDPCDAELRVKYGQTLLKAGKLDEAVEQFERAVELSGEDLSVRLKFAEVLAKNKQNAKAIAEYEKVLYAGLKRERDQFRRGKGGDETEPWRVLHRLAEFCKRAGEKDKLLEIYDDVLGLLDSPETKWKPNESGLKRILRDITEILDAKGEYNSIVELWLDYHKEMGHYSRYVIKDRIRYLDSTPLVKELQELTMADPNDYWGRFILADMLAAENRNEEAAKVYSRLLAEVPSGSRIHHDLADVFERMKRYDLMLKACKKELDRVEEGSRDYSRRSERIADIYLKLGNKEKAAEFYRKAISCDASETEHQQYQRGLFKATDGKEGVGEVDIAAVEPVEDLEAMRLQAESLLRQNRDYSGAAELYEQILGKAPTDIESMVRLGEAYEGLGKIKEATVLYEKVAFDNDIRKWAIGSSYYGADSDLERIYRQNKDIKKQIKLFTLTGCGNYSDIRGRLKSHKEFEEFHKYLLEQLEQTPKNLKMRFYLVHHYFERTETSRACEILEQLKIELTNEQGNVRNTSHAIQLAKGFERLGKFEEALAVLPVADYENNPDRNDWMGELLMRLYAKVGQFEKTLEICRLRLKKDPKGHNIIKVAEQLGEAARYHVDGDNLLSLFLKDAKDEMSLRYYRRFYGGVKAYLATHPADQVSRTNGTDIISLLKEGRRVRVPKDCRSFADFLEQLAFQADTIATQSFMGNYGQQMKPPRIDVTTGSAFEILAAALDNTNIPMVISEEGYWEFFESGDKSRKIHYRGQGGLLCKLERFNRQADRAHIWAHIPVLFDQMLKEDIVSVQWLIKVAEAVDDKGRQVPIPRMGIHWSPANNFEVNLGKEKPPAKSIKKLRIKTAVAVATKWATFKIDRLDHSEPIVVEKDGVRIQIEPIKEIKWGTKPCWGIPIDIRRKNIELKARLNDEIYFITRDGVKLRTSRNDLSQGKTQLRPDIGAFDPATTSLLIREPSVIEIVPFELTFKDIPIIDR